jgi:hypothetical protein
MPVPLCPSERAPGTHWIGGWVDLTAGLEDMKNRKFLHYRDSNSDPSVVQLVASRYTEKSSSISSYFSVLMGSIFMYISIVEFCLCLLPASR